MARSRDISKVLSSSTALATDSELGLVLITTSNFSGVSNHSIDNVFSSSYTNYVAVADFLGSGANFGEIRMRTTTDETTNAYFWQRLIANSTTISGSSQANQTTWDFGKFQTHTTGRIFHFFRPNLAESTGYESHAGVFDYIALYAGVLTTGTQYTGFKIIASSGTFTGTIKVYGYN